MEDLLQEVQLQLQHQQMQLDEQKHSIMMFHDVMREMDHEQQQQSILVHELEGTIVEARKYTLKELKLMRQKIEQQHAA